MPTYKFYSLENKLIEQVYSEQTANVKLAKFTGFYIGKHSIKYSLLNGKNHRIGGPAFEYISGAVSYWVYGKPVTKEQHDLLYDLMKLKNI